MAPARGSVRPVLRATYAHFYPDSFTGAGGQAEGYIIDVINTLAVQDMMSAFPSPGIRLHFLIVSPWARSTSCRFSA